MAFTAEDILTEFVEASCTVTDWTVIREFSLFRRNECTRRRVAEHYAVPANRKRILKYMKEYRSRPEVKERAREYKKTHAYLENGRIRQKRYYAKHRERILADERAKRRTA